MVRMAGTMDIGLGETPIRMQSAFSTLEGLRPALHKAILEEAIGTRLPEMEEPGWNLLGSGVEQITGLDRAQVNEQALRYYHTDPVAHYMVKLHNAYVFGRGITKKAADDDVEGWLARFWRHPRNKTSISTASAQWRLNKELQLNGELFLIFYTSTTSGTVTVRSVPPNEITRVLRPPGDNQMARGFVWEYTDADGKAVKHVVPDWRHFDKDRPDVHQMRGAVNTEYAMMHILAEDLGGRGVSQLAASIPWIKALKGFMEDRATLTLALATFAFKQKVRGNRQAMRRVGDQWSAYESQLRYASSGVDNRERRQGANTLIENESATLEQLKVDSGSSQAYQDMRMFRQQAGIGHAIFEHYLGDPSTGNLATATAMELPMQKHFEFEQEFWGDVFEDIFAFVIWQGMRFGALKGKGAWEVDWSGGSPLWVVGEGKDVDLSVAVTFPPIVQKDISLWSNTLLQIAQAERWTGQMILPPAQKMHTALQVMGYSDQAAALMEEWEGKDFVHPTITPAASPAADVVEAARKIVAHLEEQKGDEKPPDIGKALPKAKAEKTPPITKKEIDKAFDDWAKLPPLEDIAKELGLDVENLDDA